MLHSKVEIEVRDHVRKGALLHFQHTLARLRALRETPAPVAKIHQRGVQWKQGAVFHIIL